MNTVNIVSSLGIIETCVSVNGVALKGQEFTWVGANGDTVDVSGCYYTDTGTHFISEEIPFPGELIYVILYHINYSPFQSQTIVDLSIFYCLVLVPMQNPLLH